MKRFLSLSAEAILLAAILISGCSSAATEQSFSNTQNASLTSEAAEPIPHTSTTESSHSEASGWTPVLDINMSHPIFLAGFLNDDFGVALGPNDEIRYTEDGGKTWLKGDNNSADRYCLDIVDKNILWCGGNMGNVCMSSDGGRTWTLVSTVYTIIGHSNIDFVDNTTGWVATPSEFIGTVDGGLTWTRIPLPEGAEGVAAICLRTTEKGYLLSRDGMLYLTADGGATWSSRDLGFKNYDITDINKQPKLSKSIPTVADMCFTDEMNGTIVFIGMSSSGKGYHTWCLNTKDGGVTWETELISETDFTPSKVFISGDGQYLTLSDKNSRTVVLKKKA